MYQELRAVEDEPAQKVMLELSCHTPTLGPPCQGVYLAQSHLT